MRDVIEPGRNLGHVDRDHHAPRQPAGEDERNAKKEEASRQQQQQKLPSRAELEAAGQAGGGYPGSSEAAAVLVDDLRSGSGDTAKKEACEDCN